MLVATGTLNSGQGNALNAKLDAALEMLQQVQTTAAANRVQAFVNQVEDLVSAGTPTAEQAQDLIADAEGVLAAIQ